MNDTTATVETAVEETVLDLDTSLFTGTPEELAEATGESDGETDLATIVHELTETVFGTATTITAYKIAKVINGVFEATGTDKRIPPQMMYNYSSKGMIVKGYKGKEYTFEQVETYVNKYTVKYI